MITLLLDTKSKKFIESIPEKSNSLQISLLRAVNSSGDSLVRKMLNKYDYLTIVDIPDDAVNKAKKLFLFYFSDETSNSIFKIEAINEKNALVGHFSSTKVAAQDVFGDKGQIERSIIFNKKAYGYQYKLYY